MLSIESKHPLEHRGNITAYDITFLVADTAMQNAYLESYLEALFPKIWELWLTIESAFISDEGCHCHPYRQVH